MTKDISIVIPAYNEAARLPGNLAPLDAKLRRIGREYEVIVVVEKCADGTLEAVREAAQPFERFDIVDSPTHRGKGSAVRTGVLRARGGIVFYMDADLSTGLDAIGRFLDYFDMHPQIDVLVGNRQHPQSRITRHQSGFRERLGQTFNRLVQAWAFRGIADTQCGFKALRREAAREIFSRQVLDGFAFDVEVLLLAAEMGFQIADLPVEWNNSPDSTVHVVRDSARMLRDVLKVRALVQRTLRDRPLAPTPRATPGRH